MEFLIFSYQFLFTFLLFVFMVLKIASRSSTKIPPGPWKLPIIGNMHHMSGSLPHHRMRDLAKKHGPLMSLKFGERCMVIVSSAEIAKEVMKTHDLNFSNRPSNITARLITYNCRDIAMAPYGNYWRELRKICTLELLSGKRVQSFRSLREEEVSNLTNYISAHKGSLINLCEKISSTTYGTISRAAFGSKCRDKEEIIPLFKEIGQITGGLLVYDLFPSVKVLPLISGVFRKLEKIHLRIDRILENIIVDHKAKKAIRENGDGQGEEDLVDVLLRIQEDGNLDFPFTVTDIKAVTLDLFMAGVDTSSTAVEWAISEMLRNPRVMKKAQVEVRKAFAKKGYVDEAGLDELKYLKLVIKETMRLHPPIPMLLPRESMERCQINGYEIPAKTQVIVNAWAIGRDPEQWIEAESFHPERFEESSVDYKGANFQLIPFGAGRRMCPGITFGIAIVELPLASLLYHFDWKLADGIKLEDLDMTEAFGSSVRRKTDLHVIPIPYHPLSC